MAAVEGLKLVLDVGAQMVIFEGDSRLGIESIESSNQVLFYSGSLVHEISKLGPRFSRLKAQYVPRNCNKITDSFAHLAKICWIKSVVWRCPKLY